MPKPAPDSVSLNKFISDTGFCSRREADGYVEDGRVTINGRTARTGNRVNPGDLVEIDGESLGRKRAPVYLAYNKPAGVTSTTDTKDKTNIVSAIAFKERIFPVGRLDKDSEGLIFLTNDGGIVNRILRAGNAHEKEYVVGVDKTISPEFLRSMASGVRIASNETTLPCKISQEGKNGFRITLVQGLNRQIRRMCSTLGYEVTRLKRVRIMNMHLGNLPVGHWRYFNAEETATLQRLIESSSEAAAPVRKRKAAPENVADSATKPAPAARSAAPKTAGPRTSNRTERPSATPRSNDGQRETTAARKTAQAPQKTAKPGERPAKKSVKPISKPSTKPAAKTAEKKPAPAAETPGRRGVGKNGSFKDFRNKRGKKG